MKFKKILVYNIDKTTNLDSKSWKRIESLGEKIVFVPKADPKFRNELTDTDCVLVNFGTEIGKENIDNAPKLKYIGVMATAFGKIDVAHAAKKAIVVANLKGYSTESVAEFIFAAILEYFRGLEEGKKRGRAGNYSEAGIPAFEIRNKMFGIVGLGAIGQRVAEIALGFGADVAYWSRNRKDSFGKKGLKYLPFDKLISSADIISINLAQTKETEKIFDKSVFQKIKKNAIIINTAPMELVDIPELARRLSKKDIVFILDHSDEMSQTDLKIISKYPNCIIYPPIAYITGEAAENKRRIFIGNVEAFLAGKPQNVIS